MLVVAPATNPPPPCLPQYKDRCLDSLEVQTLTMGTKVLVDRQVDNRVHIREAVGNVVAESIAGPLMIGLLLCCILHRVFR